MKKATSRDVAKAANVSQSLVSRVFSNKGRVGKETRIRILAAAEELGWTPNALAAGVVIYQGDRELAEGTGRSAGRDQFYLDLF